MSDAPRHLDGNVTAGALSTVFAFEVTTIRCTCAACGTTAVLAEHHVYTDAPGTVVRCASCEAVVMRYAETPGYTWVDLRGATVLQVPTPGSDGPAG